ncbi:hypothetical protein [Nocardioides sp. GY 10127]|uniref:hypothetical protein n=1 Tax=Nocardioides sp. GY 10127 TaxID=2569762 RepID=UPI0010A81616|nr:hypothetical protein [Nocardioides sp. GY 10127]TIC79272.1 hypothetical protein E8D37_16825 [Nocardioides sp. GY 10127]
MTRYEQALHATMLVGWVKDLIVRCLFVGAVTLILASLLLAEADAPGGLAFGVAFLAVLGVLWVASPPIPELYGDEDEDEGEHLGIGRSYGTQV